MISDKPKWCALMMNGYKTVEVRTSKALATAIQKLIDKYGYADIYVCCTKGKPNLWLPYEYDCFELDEASQPYLSDKPIFDIDAKMNGKVVFKFRCYKVEHFEYDTCSRDICGYWLDNGQIFKNKGTCLSADELWNYIKGKDGYAIHISDLEIFDEPKELSEFYHYVKYNKEMARLNKQDWDFVQLTKAPQNFCYIESRE